MSKASEGSRVRIPKVDARDVEANWVALLKIMTTTTNLADSAPAAVTALDGQEEYYEYFGLRCSVHDVAAFGRFWKEFYCLTPMRQHYLTNRNNTSLQYRDGTVCGG